MRSEIKGTIPRLMDSSLDGIMPRTFRTFRKLSDAVTFVQKHAKRSPRLSKSEYGCDPRDVRYVVNFYGSPRRERVKLAPKKIYVCSLSTALAIVRK